MPELSPTRFTMVPARRSNEPTARRRARRILGALFLAATLSVVAVFIAFSNKGGKTDLSSVKPKGRDLAYTSAVTYLMGGTLNVPRAQTFNAVEAAKAPDYLSGGKRGALSYQSLSWVGFTPQAFGSKESKITEFEVHHFLITLPPQQGKQTGQGSQNPPARAAGAPSPSGSPSAAPSQSGGPAPSASPTTQAPAPPGSNDPNAPPMANVVQLDVSILLTPQGPRLAGSPSFTAWQGGGEPAGQADYTNYTNKSTSVSGSVKNQIAQWAKAYANGDSAALLTLTGDQNPGHKYVGLSGFTLPNSDQAVQTLTAIQVEGGMNVVRVRIMLARADSTGTVSGGKGAGQFVTFADFDLLVGAPGGARPTIVAWGPAGSAAELQPYSNAAGQ